MAWPYVPQGRPAAGPGDPVGVLPPPRIIPCENGVIGSNVAPTTILSGVSGLWTIGLLGALRFADHVYDVPSFGEVVFLSVGDSPTVKVGASLKDGLSAVGALRYQDWITLALNGETVWASPGWENDSASFAHELLLVEVAPAAAVLEMPTTAFISRNGGPGRRYVDDAAGGGLPVNLTGIATATITVPLPTRQAQGTIAAESDVSGIATAAPWTVLFDGTADVSNYIVHNVGTQDVWLCFDAGDSPLAKGFKVPIGATFFDDEWKGPVLAGAGAAGGEVHYIRRV